MGKQIIEKVVETAENIGGAVSNIKDTGAEKVRSIMDELNNSSDIIAKSGFNLDEIEISLGIPPEVIGCFHFIKKISDEEKKKLLEETEEKPTVNTVLKCLFKGEEFYSKMKLGKFKMDIIELSMGITPGINMKFKKI